MNVWEALVKILKIGPYGAISATVIAVGLMIQGALHMQTVNRIITPTELKNTIMLFLILSLGSILAIKIIEVNYE